MNFDRNSGLLSVDFDLSTMPEEEFLQDLENLKDSVLNWYWDESNMKRHIQNIMADSSFEALEEKVHNSPSDDSEIWGSIYGAIFRKKEDKYSRGIATDAVFIRARGLRFALAKTNSGKWVFMNLYGIMSTCTPAFIYYSQDGKIIVITSVGGDCAIFEYDDNSMMYVLVNPKI